MDVGPRKSSVYFELPSRLPRRVFGLARRIMKMASRKPSSLWAYPDSLYTPHNKNFFDSQFFHEAYDYAILKAGADYRIPWRVHQLQWGLALSSGVPGSVVEVGTGRGFMAAAMLKTMEVLAIQKELVVFDRFLPPQEQAQRKFQDFYASSPEDFKNRFADRDNLKVVVGDIFDTLSREIPEQISFLHVDLNSAKAETFVLENLWDSISPGGVILLDDYANRGFEDTYEAHNRFFSSKGKHVLTFAAGNGLVVK